MSRTLPTCAKQPAPTSPPESCELAAAIRVGQKMLAAYSDSSRDSFSYPEAYGSLAEALRILLHALGAEPEVCDSAEQRRNAGTDRSSEGWTSMTKVQLPGDETVGLAVASGRCPAAHPEDTTPCGGPVVVTVLDADNAGADGCEHHGARLLASLDRGRVYALPDAPSGAAIRVFKAADSIRPFPWVDGPRTRDGQLSRAETRARGERP